MTDDDLRNLVTAVWQVLDDMGTEGQSCCGVAKAMLRHAIEPFLGAIDCTDEDFDYKLSMAVDVLKKVGLMK